MLQMCERMYKYILFLLCTLLLTGCGGEEQLADDQNIVISSADLKDGEWNEVITNTDFGGNKSPQLSWNAIDGAGCYAIIMIDPDGNNWLHWIETDIRQNDIPTGYSSSDKYIGPYPPGGTHHYIIYVYALKEPRNVTSARFDQGSNNIDLIQDELMEGENCLGYGMIEGTYTAR